MHEEVQHRLDALARTLTEELGESADVSYREDLPGMKLVDVVPRSPTALGFTWTEFLDRQEGDLQFEAGHHGGQWELGATQEDVQFIEDMARQWELGATQEDVQFIEDMARAVIAGRVVETFGPGRSRVEVTLLNGQVVRETGYVSGRGCLPIPGWVRRGRRVTYAPYRAKD